VSQETAKVVRWLFHILVVSQATKQASQAPAIITNWVSKLQKASGAGTPRSLIHVLVVLQAMKQVSPAPAIITKALREVQQVHVRV
jgi:hypothetical protein